MFSANTSIFFRINSTRLIVLLGVLLLSFGLAAPAHAQSIANGLVGYWPFDESSGSTSTDFSGSNNTATLHSPNSFTNNIAPLDFANPHAFVSVNNANSYATAPGKNIDNLQKFTIAFWVRVNAATPFPAMTLLSLNNGKAGFGYYDRGNLYFDITVNGLPRRLFKLNSNIADGAYHHLVGSYDGATIQFYYDGAPYIDLGASGPVPTGQGVSFSTPDAPLDGALDDVRIYNRALTNIEVATLVYNCSNVQGIPANECRALVALANNTYAEQWVASNQWLANRTPCNWFGVLCNNGHVIVLNLPQNRLHGELPPALGNLSELVVLDLPNNQLTGNIPFELGSLDKLQTLDLYGNQLSGQIPFTLGNLSQLTTLRLYNNQLRGAIPTQLANLTNLLTLDLGYNMLTADVPTLVSFLNNKQPDWATTQTVPPTNLKATVQSSTGISLTWTPIAYTADSGYYEVFSTTQRSGIYKSAGKTANKSASVFLVNGLTPGQTYSFVVRTFTPKHGLQQNDLLSDSSDPLDVTLTTSKPTITIVLDTQPDSVANFRFTGSLGNFVLDDMTPQDTDAYSNSKTFSVDSGTYTVTETVPNGWAIANISCNPPTGSIANLNNKQIIINVASGANRTCIFVTQRAGQIIAGKYNDHNHNHVRDTADEWLSSWSMQLLRGPLTLVATQTTDGKGRTVFANLLPGVYTICEVPQAGWFNLTPSTLAPDYNRPCYTVSVVAGQAVWTRFGNSPTPLATAADRQEFRDVILCELPEVDDAGVAVKAERDPWEEEEEQAGNTIFLPLVSR